MRCFPEAKLFGAAEAAIKFDSGGEVLTTEAAFLRACEGGEGAIGAQGVAEFVTLVLGEILLDDKVFRNGPILCGAGKDQFGFEFSGVFTTKLRERFGRRFGVSDDFFSDTACFVDVLEWD
jgi:hypothetical protein